MCPPREGSFRDEHGNAMKPAVVVDYNHHMDDIDKADQMASSYSVSHRTWKWTKKLFFHLLDLAILNSYILLTSCGGKKMSHRNFQLTLGRAVLVSGNICRLDTLHNKNWPGWGTKWWCRMCSSRSITPKVRSKCVKCDIMLCVDWNCFTEYHTNGQLLEHLFIHPPYKQLKPVPKWEYREVEIHNFFLNYLLNYTMDIFMAF